MRARAGTWIAAFFWLAVAGMFSHAGAAELGKNFAGEACRSANQLEADQPTPITCGDSAEPVGQVLFSSAPQDAAALRAALLHLAKSENGGLDCGDPQWTEDGEAELQICTLRSVGWTRIVVGMRAGSRIYRAEGPPSALPILETAILDDAGVPAPASARELLGILSAKLPASIVHAPAQDFANYEAAIEAGRLAAAADRFASAESDYRQALAITERLYGPSSLVVGQVLMELALQASNQKQFVEAAKLFQRADPIIQASADGNVRARYESYLALDAANRRQYADALRFAHLATTERRAEIAAAIARNAQTGSQNEIPVSQGELAHALRIEAEMALRLGQLSTAKTAADEALWIVSDEPGLPLWWRADTVALAGEIDDRLGEAADAEKNLRDARDIDERVFGDGPPTAFADLRLGAFYARQQDYASALAVYDSGFAIADKDPVARVEVFPDDVIAYANAEAAAGNPADRDDKIFRALQLVRLGAADETLARIAASQVAADRTLSDLVSQLQAAERDRDLARAALAAEYAKPQDERNGAGEAELQTHEKQTNAGVDLLLAKIRAQAPSYANLTDPAALDLSAVQANLAASDALVAFLFGQEKGYAVVIRSHGFAAVPLDIGEDALANDLARLRKAFVPIAGRPPEFDLKGAYQLYGALLEPLNGALAGANHVIVVPGPVLSGFPLAALVTAPPGSSDYVHAAWLIKEYALSEVPSLRTFVTLKQASAAAVPPPRPFLGIGNPPFEGPGGAAGEKALEAFTGSCREDGPVSADLLRALPPLPDTAQEVRKVGANIGGGAAVFLLGADASERNLRAEPLDQFAVLYFATHGILPGELRCASQPALALAPPATPAASAADDGLLEASEIADLKLNADLVVLSACNTASSADGLGGGALQGLSDSFFAAGARAVLASRWQISSEATEMLMTKVFDPANRARGLAEALRRAELDLAGNTATSHPYYWASFTSIGNTAAYGHSAALAQAEH